MPITDLRGRTFGRLSVPPRAEPVIRNRHAYWPVVCECGTRTEVRGTKLTGGQTVSCGCWRADPNIRQAARMKTPAKRRRAIAAQGGAARWTPAG